MNGQLGADSSSLVADWSLFNGTPVSLIKRKMNHRYPGLEEHWAQNLTVIWCSSAPGSRLRVCESVRVNSGQSRSYSDARGCFSEALYVICWMCACSSLVFYLHYRHWSAKFQSLRTSAAAQLCAPRATPIQPRCRRFFFWRLIAIKAHFN